MKVEELKSNVEITDGVEVQANGKSITVKGPKGELTRTFNFPKLTLSVAEGNVDVLFKNATKREKTQMGTTKAHIKNMIKGVSEAHKYKLKICSGHFPMNVSMNNAQLIVKNFLGEKVPRVLKLKDGADVKIEDTFIIVESIDIEKAGQVAADIEQLTRITNRDIRIFQDGIYIIEKPGKVLI